MKPLDELISEKNHLELKLNELKIEINSHPQSLTNIELTDDEIEELDRITINLDEIRNKQAVLETLYDADYSKYCSIIKTIAQKFKVTRGSVVDRWEKLSKRNRS